MHAQPRRRRLPEWLLGLVIAVVLAVAAIWAADLLGAGDDPRFEGTTTTTGDEASAGGITLVLWDGTRRALSEYSGTPVVLNFWASWCPPCIAEMPDFEAVHSDVGDRVAFIGVNSQDPDRAAAEELVAETGVTYQLASDPDGALHAELGLFGMPATVFVSATGEIVETHNGVLFEEDLRERVEANFGVSAGG